MTTYGPPSCDKDLNRGDTVNYRVTVREPLTGEHPEPRPIDLTGSQLVFQVKRQPEPRQLCPADPVVITKTSDDVNEIEILDQSVPETLGKALIKLRTEDTEFLPPGTYAYSIRVITAMGGQRTVTKGRIFLKGPATAAENWTPPCGG